MITLHHLESSRSHRIFWLLEELQLPYELHRYARGRQWLRAPEALLREQPWFAGDELSGADIQMSYPLTLARQHAGVLGEPACRAIDGYLEDLAARPAWQRALARGGGLSPLV